MRGLTGTMAPFSYMNPYFLQSSKCREALFLSYEGADRSRHCSVFSLSLNAVKELPWRTLETVLDKVSLLPVGWRCRVV